MPMKSMMGADEGEMDSLYAGGEPEGGKSEGKESIDQEEAENAETALVPMKILQGKDGEPVNEGDEIVVQVVKTHGDEAEIRYAPKEKTTEKEQSPDQELDALDTY